MKKYPRIKTYKNQILIVMELDEKGAETTDWYSLKEIRQILKEQREEEKIKIDGTEDCEYDCDAEQQKTENSLKHLHQEITEHIHPYVTTKIEKINVTKDKG